MKMYTLKTLVVLLCFISFYSVTAQSADNLFKIQTSEDNVIMVDGKKADVADINPGRVKSMVILKGDKLTAEYNAKGKSVILIETKGINDTARSMAEVALAGKPSVFSASAPPLLIIDGERTDRAIETIRPDKIVSIMIIKGEDKTASYGPDGKNGVILIETNEKKKR